MQPAGGCASPGQKTGRSGWNLGKVAHYGKLHLLDMPCRTACSLLLMRLTRAIYIFALVAGLAVYSLDCFAASTPDDAMQCCDNMPCPQHSHDASQDCCQNMSSLQAPFIQSHIVDISGQALVVLAVLPAVDAFQPLASSTSILFAQHSHAPPLLPIASATPLRV